MCIAAVICVAIAVPQILSAKKRASTPMQRHKLTDEQLARHDKLNDRQRELYYEGKPFRVECVAHASEKLVCFFTQQ